MWGITGRHINAIEYLAPHHVDDMSFYLIHNLLFFKVVVAHLDDKDDGCTDSRDEVGDKEENTCTDALFNTEYQPLAHETQAAYRHHAETWQRDTVGLAGTNGLDGLWQIAEDEPDAA